MPSEGKRYMKKTMNCLLKATSQSHHPKHWGGWRNMFFLIGGIWMTMFLGSCLDHEEDLYKQDYADLTFYLQTTGGQQTRAYVGEEAGNNDENTIHTYKVWLFEHETGNFIDYTETVSNDKKVTMKVPQRIITGDKTVDVYVLGNPETVVPQATLANLGRGTSRDDLQSMLLGASSTPNTTYFIPTANGEDGTHAVPSTGLPFSQVKADWVIAENNQIKENLETIYLTRAVSKLHFCFARTKGETAVEGVQAIDALAGCEITGIKIAGAKIASEEYLFPKQDASNYGTKDDGATYYGDRIPNLKTPLNYEQTAMLWGKDVTGTTYSETSVVAPLISNSEIKALLHPELLEFRSTGHETETGAQYDQRLAAAGITSQYLTYLRETDEKLQVTIYYRLKAKDATAQKDEIRSTTFTMKDNNDFTRNHTWTVYAYFDGAALYVHPTLMPWDNGGRLIYKTEGASTLNTEAYKVYSTRTTNYAETNSPFDIWSHRDWHWNEYATAVSTTSNYQTGTKPLYSPCITITAKSKQRQRIQCNNTASFGFIQVTTVNEVDTYSGILDNIVIEPNTSDPIRFYVVPRGELTEDDNPATTVTLIKLSDYSAQRLPWNTGIFPGSEDNTEGWFHYIPSGQYYNSDITRTYDPNNAEAKWVESQWHP